METYDVIVAGAGMAGSLAAAVAAGRGLRTLLLDRNIESEVGKKTNWGWVCGDAVSAEHLKFVNSKAGISFGKPELETKVDSIFVLSPDLKYRYRFEGEGYILDRPVFEHKLLEHAVASKAEYMPEFEVEGPIIENNFIAGVFGKDAKKAHREIRAKIVVDALGIATTLRRKLPHNPYVDREIDISDIELTGRYIYEFDQDHEDLNFFDKRNAIIHLNQVIAPGGYGWVFPEGDNIMNVGIGVQKQSLEIRNQRLGKKDTLHTLMDEYVRSNPVAKNLRLYNKNNNGKGYWSVAVRRQLESLVFNGYMGAGDSMAMPNPISAGGIGPSMVAGVLAGENAVRAINNGDVSTTGLWRYNLDFNEAYGKKTAGLEVFRVYLQSLNNDVLNYGIRTFVTAKEAEQLSYGLVPELNLATKFRMVLKGASNVTAFSNLMYAVKKMKELNALYNKYPQSPDGFLEWRGAVESTMKDAKSRFKPNPV